jgi:2-polyprenyl-6-methoxyphenol hydroxylase-like FAD-dependent oxidoreductase
MLLEEAGIEATAYEGRPEPNDEAGAFLNLAPNGLAVLDALGIGQEIKESGAPATTIAFYNHCGKKLGENPEKTVLLKRLAGVEVTFWRRMVPWPAAWTTRRAPPARG